MKNVSIIGSGFSGLSAACYLAKEGYKVSVYEKNDTIGGRARQFTEDGFTFDMGPSWYWMPEIFESFFNDFGKSTTDYYELVQLDPGYKVYFGQNDVVSVSASLEKTYKTFDALEKGSSVFLKKFLKKAGYNYHVAMNKVVDKPGKSPLELVMPETIGNLGQFAASLGSYVRKNIKDKRLAQILEFPVLFLGAKPEKTPLFYCFMNHADMVLGTWHPMGGFYKVIEGMEQLCNELGVKIHTNAKVSRIHIKNRKIQGVQVNGEMLHTDFVVSGADYHHTETLLDKQARNYSRRYWQKRTFAPSALIYFVGFNKKLENVNHHTLFFDADFGVHASNIYDTPAWPKQPLFYASFPSITDSSVAPNGKEAAVFLIPIAPGISENGDTSEKYFRQIISRMEETTSQELVSSIVYKKSYGPSDFTGDYNAYKGNAYGLANTLFQTGFLKPKMVNKKISNLLYTGQLTVPGPGVPPSIISGRIAAHEAMEIMKKSHETAI